MISAIWRAFAQLNDPRFRKSLWIGMVLAIVLYALLHGAIAWLLANTSLFSWLWADRLVDFLGWLAVFLLSAPFFPAVVTLILSFLLESVASAVEARHYPGRGAARPQPFGETLRGALHFAALAILVNLVALPFYLLSLFFIPGLNIVIFYTVNGVLLGREYFELVASRRLDPLAVKSLRLAHRPKIFLAGCVIAFLMTLPFINLAAPILGAAFMLHILESLQASDKSV